MPAVLDPPGLITWRRFLLADDMSLTTLTTIELMVSDVLQLPRAPEAMAAQEAAERERAEAAVRAAYEADVAAVRQLRMTLRDVATKLLCDRRWRALAAPVSPEDDPIYWERVRFFCHQTKVEVCDCGWNHTPFCSLCPNTTMYCAHSLLWCHRRMTSPSGSRLGTSASRRHGVYTFCTPCPSIKYYPMILADFVFA